MNTRLRIVIPAVLVGFGLSAQQNSQELNEGVVLDSTFRSLGSKNPKQIPCSSSGCRLALDIDSDTVWSTPNPSITEAETSSYGTRFLLPRERFADFQTEPGATLLPIELAPKQGPPTRHATC